MGRHRRGNGQYQQSNKVQTTEIQNGMISIPPNDIGPIRPQQGCQIGQTTIVPVPRNGGCFIVL